MNRRNLNLISSVLYFISICSIFVLSAHFFGILFFKHDEKVILGSIFILCGYVAGYIKCSLISSKKAKKRIIRHHLLIVFIFYILILVDFTLIDDSLGRNIFNIFTWNKASFYNYINNNTNLIPFATIKLFINGYKNHYLSFYAMLENILGNFIVFMPFTFFLKMFVPFCKKRINIFLLVFVSVILVELLQFIFLTGSSDIDDVILNVSGAILFYIFINLKSISKLLSKLTFGNWVVND